MRPVSAELNGCCCGRDLVQTEGEAATEVVRLGARCRRLFCIFIWNAHNSHSIHLNNIRVFAVTALPLVKYSKTKCFWKQDPGYFAFYSFTFYGNCKSENRKISDWESFEGTYTLPVCHKDFQQPELTPTFLYRERGGEKQRYLLKDICEVGEWVSGGEWTSEWVVSGRLSEWISELVTA